MSFFIKCEAGPVLSTFDRIPKWSYGTILLKKNWKCFNRYYILPIALWCGSNIGYLKGVLILTRRLYGERVGLLDWDTLYKKQPQISAFIITSIPPKCRKWYKKEFRTTQVTFFSPTNHARVGKFNRKSWKNSKKFSQNSDIRPFFLVIIFYFG